MGRIRTIKPEICQSESIGRLSREARLLFILLFTVADDEGRARAHSRVLASLLYPFDDDAPRLIDRWLTELVGQDHVELYTVDGTQYLSIKKWPQHQKVDRPTASRLPSPRDPLASPREPSMLYLGPRTLDLGPSIESSLRSDSHPGGAPGLAGRQKETLFEDVVALDKAAHPEATPNARASRAGRIVKAAVAGAPVYPLAFEELWALYRPLGVKNSSKFDALRAWERLDEGDREACRRGLSAYVADIKAQQQSRADTPAKHLSTFINGRGWEPYLEAASAAVPRPPTPPEPGMPTDAELREYYRRKPDGPQGRAEENAVSRPQSADVLRPNGREGAPRDDRNPQAQRGVRRLGDVLPLVRVGTKDVDDAAEG